MKDHINLNDSSMLLERMSELIGQHEAYFNDLRGLTIINKNRLKAQLRGIYCLIYRVNKNITSGR